MALATSHRIICATALASLLGSELKARAQFEPMSLARFISEAQGGWQRLEQWDANFESQGIAEEAQGDRQIRNSTVHYVSCKFGTLCWERQSGEYSDAQYGKVLFGVNPTYGFWLGERRGEARPWVLRLVKTGNGGRAEIEHEIQTRYFFATRPHSHIDPEISFRSTLNDPNFTWERPEVLRYADKDMVRIHFRRTRKFEGFTGEFPSEGYCIFDPSNHWACAEWFTEARRREKGMPARTLVRLEYAHQPINGFRPMSKYSSRSRWDEQGDMDETTKNYRLSFTVENVRIPGNEPSSFRLSGYDLPEPIDQSYSSPRSPVWVWFLAASLTCGGMALGIHRYLQRRRRV